MEKWCKVLFPPVIILKLQFTFTKIILGHINEYLLHAISLDSLTLTHPTSRMEKHTQDTPAGPHADILSSCKR